MELGPVELLVGLLVNCVPKIETLHIDLKPLSFLGAGQPPGKKALFHVTPQTQGPLTSQTRREWAGSTPALHQNPCNALTATGMSLLRALTNPMSSCNDESIPQVKSRMEKGGVTWCRASPQASSTSRTGGGVFQQIICKVDPLRLMRIAP